MGQRKVSREVTDQRGRLLTMKETRAALNEPRYGRAAVGRGAADQSAWTVAMVRLAYFAGLAGTVWAAVHVHTYATTDPRFIVKRIEVRGNAQLSVEEVLRWSGLHAGSNIFQMSLGLAEDRLSRKGLFAYVSVARRLPDTVYIDVKERNPLAAVGNFQIDGEGMVSPRVIASQPGGFPVLLEGVQTKDLEIGKVTENAAVIVGVAVAQAIRHQGDILVKRIVVEDALNPCLVLMNDIRVKLGSQRFEEKLERMHEVLAALAEKKRLPKVIDLRYRDEAAVTFK